jgi:hypothetical protein
MSSRFTHISKITLWSSLAGAVISTLGITQAAIAQFPTTPAGVANDLQTPSDETGDPFSSSGSGGMNTMLDLIHRANFGEIRSSDQFRQDQRNTINSEAENFRNRQQQMLQQQPTQPAPTTSPTTPQR